MEERIVVNGKKVKIHYTLRVDGNVIDSSQETGPLEYEHGTGQIIPGLERVLDGLKEEDSRQVHIGPDDAYGPIDPQAIIEVPREHIKDDEVEVGMILKGRDTSGRTMKGIVKEVGEEKVTVDFNHPLAGKELFFEVEVVEIL